MGSEWAGKTVRTRCDNQSMVATVNAGTCREAVTMHLRRCLEFLEERGGFHMVAEHIRGVDNVIADALSRDKAQVACSLLQGAERMPVEEGVLEVVARAKPEEEDWERLWNFSSRKGWQSPPGERTR